MNKILTQIIWWSENFIINEQNTTSFKLYERFAEKETKTQIVPKQFVTYEIQYISGENVVIRQGERILYREGSHHKYV